MEMLVPYLLTGLITLSAAWGGTKVGMNGINKRLDTLDISFRKHIDKTESRCDDFDTRVVRLETINELRE